MVGNVRRADEPPQLLVVSLPETPEQTFSTLRKVIAGARVARETGRLFVVPAGFRRFNLSALRVRTATHAMVAPILNASVASECNALPCADSGLVLRASASLLWRLGVHSQASAEAFGLVAYSARWVARSHEMASAIGLLPGAYAAMHLRLEKAYRHFDVDLVRRKARVAMAAAHLRVLFVASDSERGALASRTFECEGGALRQWASRGRATEGLGETACDRRSTAEAMHEQLITGDSTRGHRTHVLPHPVCLFAHHLPRLDVAGTALRFHTLYVDDVLLDVWLLAGLRTDGLEVRTLSDSRARLERTERSIVDHVLCEEAKLFLRPCISCNERLSSYYQAWILQRRAAEGHRPTVDIPFDGPRNPRQRSVQRSP